MPDVHALNKQSTGSRRNAGLLREIYSIAVAFNIAITAEHRPGHENVLPDFLSRPSLHRHSDVVIAWRLAYPDDAARLVSVSPMCTAWTSATGRRGPREHLRQASRCAPTPSAPTRPRGGLLSASPPFYGVDLSQPLTELDLCILMSVFATTHKVTTVSTFIAAVAQRRSSAASAPMPSYRVTACTIRRERASRSSMATRLFRRARPQCTLDDLGTFASSALSRHVRGRARLVRLSARFLRPSPHP